jgi:hypothetical protein
LDFIIVIYNLVYKYNLIKIFNKLLKSLFVYLVEGIGDWGLGMGIGDWGLGKPQSPIPNPHNK